TVSVFILITTAPPAIDTLSLHDALPIWLGRAAGPVTEVTMNDGLLLLEAARQAPDEDGPRLAYADWCEERGDTDRATFIRLQLRSEEHTSELQSRSDLVCRLLLEKKKKK